MDKIVLNNMAFFGNHGVLQEEKTLGQKFFIDVELYLDLKEAGKTDDLTKTINYAQVYEIIKEYAQEKCYDLLETLGENICNCILKKYEVIREIKLDIRKPEAPVRGIFDYMGISISRNREDIW